jgi:hypothetical protein
MPKKLNEFLQSLIKKSGVELTDEQTAMLNNEALSAVEMPDEIVNGVNNSLISLKDAKNNHTDIRSYYHKQLYDAWDASLLSLMDDMEFPEADKNEVLVERNTNKRLPLLVKKARELENKKATANMPDKAAINKERDELNAKIRQEQEKYNKAISDFEEQRRQDRINAKKDALIMPYKTIFDDLDMDVRNSTIRNLIDKNLQDNNAHFSFDENGNFVLQKKDGTNFFGEGNQQEFPATFVEKILSRNKILKTTSKEGSQPPAGETGNNQNGNAQNPGGVNTTNGNGQGTNQAAYLKSLNGRALADIKTNAENPIIPGGFGV